MSDDDSTRNGVLAGPAAGMDEEQTSEEPQWEEFDSKRLKKMRYDPTRQRVSVEWKNGSVGHYVNVPQEAYERLRSADSVGTHLSQHIIPHYKYESGPTE